MTVVLRGQNPEHINDFYEGRNFTCAPLPPIYVVLVLTMVALLRIEAGKFVMLDYGIHYKLYG